MDDSNKAYLHHAEVGSKEDVDVGGRQKAADLASAPARLPQLPGLQGHAALEEPCSCQRWLIGLHKHTLVSISQRRGFEKNPRVKAEPQANSCTCVNQSPPKKVTLCVAPNGGEES